MRLPAEFAFLVEYMGFSKRPKLLCVCGFRCCLSYQDRDGIDGSDISRMVHERDKMYQVDWKAPRACINPRNIHAMSNIGNVERRVPLVVV